MAMPAATAEGVAMAKAHGHATSRMETADRHLVREEIPDDCEAENGG